LFERTPRAVRLTRAGEELRDRVKTHVDGLDAAIDATRRAGSGQSGRLNVGFSVNFSHVFLPRVLERLRSSAPNAVFSLSELSTDSQIEALRSDQIQLAFVPLPLADPDLMQRRLFQDPLVVVVPQGHPLTEFGSVTLAQLEEHPFVMCPRYRHTGFPYSSLDRCAAVGFKPRIVQEVGGKTLMYGLVARGLGLSIVPASSAPGHRSGVVYLPISDPVPPVDMAAVWRKETDCPLRKVMVDTAVLVAEELFGPQRQKAVA
jgi:DNA-binding transcriptional LysR family regulator